MLTPRHDRVTTRTDKWGLAAAVMALLAIPWLAREATAQDKSTAWRAENIVHGAIARIKKVGREKAFASFNDPNGSFSYREMYVTVYDFKGTCLAHGADKSRIGRSMINDKDADGKLFVKERVERARAEGKGWQEYRFMNPATKRIEKKLAYFEVLDDLIVVSGIYGS